MSGDGPFTRWVLRPVLRADLSVKARLVDAAFVHRQGLTPTIGNRILKYPAIALERLHRRAHADSQDILFARFGKLHEFHYGPTGRGYQTIGQLSPVERENRYRQQGSRLAYFAEEFADLLDYGSEDAYLDLGCGTGQNVAWLAQTRPHATIVGVDMNIDAIELIRECEKHADLTLSVGDLRDSDFIDQLLSKPVDHIVMSHVFSLVFGSSQASTRELRQGLVDRLVAACRKSVIIVDNFGRRGETVIAMEQRQRAVVSDDVLSYFAGHRSGRTVMAESPQSQAVMFFKSR